MSLIVTHVSKYGIIHACDSNITFVKPTRKVEEHAKLFEIPYLNAALTLAGTYVVGRFLMDEWMSDFIAQTKNRNVNTLHEFADTLRDAFQSEMTAQQKKHPTLVHIAGYVDDSNQYHPELWFVRNAWNMSPQGEYIDIREEFQVSEDLWSRDFLKFNLTSLFENGGFQTYANGFSDGRIIYMSILSQHSRMFNSIWSNPDWRFRRPESLKEMEAFVRMDMQYISELFKMTFYEAAYIGGTITTHLIPNPNTQS